MKLDELLKQNAAWLEQAKKRRVFDKVDYTSVKFPDEQRERRMAEIKTRIDSLARRKEDAAAAYDRAIAIEKAELDALSAQKPPPTPKPPPTQKPPTPPRPSGTGRKASAKRS